MIWKDLCDSVLLVEMHIIKKKKQQQLNDAHSLGISASINE